MPLADGSTMTCLALSLDHLTAPVSAHGSPTVSCCLCWRPHPCPDAAHSHSITTPPWFANFAVAHRLHYWIAEHSPDRLQFVRGLPVTGLHPLLNSNCPACKHRQGGARRFAGKLYLRKFADHAWGCQILHLQAFCQNRNRQRIQCKSDGRCRRKSCRFHVVAQSGRALTKCCQSLILQALRAWAYCRNHGSAGRANQRPLLLIWCTLKILNRGG